MFHTQKLGSIINYGYSDYEPNIRKIQNDQESMAKFYIAFSKLAWNCNLGDLETELVRVIFITNLRNEEVQKIFCIQNFFSNPQKGAKINQKFVKYSVNSSVHKSHYVKTEPILSIIENAK